MNEWGVGGAYDRISDEMRNQDKQWGQQDHPDGTGDVYLFGISFKEMLEYVRSYNDHPPANYKDGELVQMPHLWSLILLEEVLEALVEEDPDELEKELVQVSAVAVQWMKAIDRRRNGRLSW